VNALFDLDGTLCDPREGIERGFKHAFDAVGLPFPGKDRIAAQIGRPLLDCFRALDCGPAGLEAARHFHEFFEARGFAEARLYDGALDCLRQLRREGWGLALASSKPTFAVRFVAEAMDLLPCLDGLYGCAPDDLNPDKRAIVGEAWLGPPPGRSSSATANRTGTPPPRWACLLWPRRGVLEARRNMPAPWRWLLHRLN
jgi:phosphoglycolate phosphatase-like HAD superfamily hydrolase